MNSTTAPDSQVPDAENGENEKESTAVKTDPNSIWVRMLFMLVFVVLYGVTRVVLTAVIVLQFFWVVFTDNSNDRLLELGQSLASYTYQILHYLTFNRDDRPFPFAAWPRGVPK